MSTECKKNGIKNYFCTGPKENEIDLVPQMETCGLWADISGAKNIVAYHAQSLIYNVNNNAVEGFNSVVAKFVGEKRVNFSLRGSYSARCNAAVSSFNFGPKYLNNFHKKVTNVSPGVYTKKFVNKINKNQHSRVGRRLNFEKARYKLFNLSCNHIEVSYNNMGCNNMQSKKKCIAGPDEDYGAVDIGIGSSSTRYGIENESVARNAFQKTTKEKIEPSGLFIHKSKPYLAASPDGLIGKDGIIEIKCPPSIKEYTLDEAVDKKKIKYMISDGFIVDKIKKDVEFWNSKIEPFVTTFYMDSFLPEIIDPRFDRGLPIRSGISEKKLS
ncbi:hypothetical protein AGLY_008923 [Aphis glycines]|uniref:YqaJ viral recombinase domain-containing protein n=1 Tax=Aphis glycines TaxID=307491 RepID=A0A6G0TJ35_APHGL|nr:hypothetical protein AGLY_008923 [Aphis glycines]